MRFVLARLLLSLVAFGSVLWPDPAGAQNPGARFRVAYLSPATASGANKAAFDEFKRELIDRGYREGDNLIIDARWASGDVERLPALAADLVSLKPDVIVAVTTPVTAAARGATSTIPIVMTLVSDPVGAGFVASLAHPGGTVTGVMDYGIELSDKFVELAMELSPTSKAVGVLTSDNPAHRMQLERMEIVAASRLSIVPVMGRSPQEIDDAFVSAAKRGTKVMIVLGGLPQGSLREKIAELALHHKMATIAPQHPYVEAGCLLSYGPKWSVQYRMAGEFVAKLLGGQRPGDLPVQQPFNVELVINRRTADALGVKIPQSLIQRADEVIE
jgi:putative ABC transport system substrate-binding protein